MMTAAIGVNFNTIRDLIETCRAHEALPTDYQELAITLSQTLDQHPDRVGELCEAWKRATPLVLQRLKEHYPAPQAYSSMDPCSAFLSKFAKVLIDQKQVERLKCHSEQKQSVALTELSGFVVEEYKKREKWQQAAYASCLVADDHLQQQVCLPYLESLQRTRQSSKIIEALQQMTHPNALRAAIDRILPAEREGNAGFSNFIIRLIDPENMAGTAEMRAAAVASWVCKHGVFDLLFVNQMARHFRAVALNDAAEKIEHHAQFLRVKILLSVACVFGLMGICLFANPGQGSGSDSSLSNGAF